MKKLFLLLAMFQANTCLAIDQFRFKNDNTVVEVQRGDAALNRIQSYQGSYTYCACEDESGLEALDLEGHFTLNQYVINKERKEVAFSGKIQTFHFRRMGATYPFAYNNCLTKAHELLVACKFYE